MTKRELLEKINRISNIASDLETNLRDIHEDAKRLERLIEELPSEEGDIDDNEEKDKEEDE